MEERRVGDLIRSPIEGVQQGVHQVIEVLQARRGVAIGWALALILGVLSYLLDLGAGSVWNGDDALFVLAVQGMQHGTLTMAEAARSIPPPNGVPLALWQVWGLIRLFGPGEAVLRLLPVLATLGCAGCLLAIAIDVGVGRHAGGLGALVLLGLPLTYELSHRVLPDMLSAFASTGAVALLCHSLHGHKFDRHILPHHRDEDAPAPLPLRRWTMVVAAGGVGAAALVSPRAALTALLFALGDILLAHRYLLRKRRVWLALGASAVLTALATTLHPGGVTDWVRLPEPGVPTSSVLSLWHQGDTLYAHYIGKVVIVAAAFGLLLGSLRRTSRPLLIWVAVSIIMSWLGEISPAPRGLGLVLPPLALCAAVGLESPVRWLGRLGMVVTGMALVGMVLVYTEGEAVLHRDDTVKALAQVQRHAPPGALICTLGVPAASPTFYSQQKVAEFSSAAEVRAVLQEGQPLSCLVRQSEVSALAAAFGKRRRDETAPFQSVLETSLDIETPPPDTEGPDVVLVSR